MSFQDLGSIPAGTDLFIDANIFVYAFTQSSRQCITLLERCAREEIFGITSLDVVNDVTHRLMLAEALAKGIINKQNAQKLKERRAAIRSLTDYWSYTSRVLVLNILLLESEESYLPKAHALRTQLGLMTKDSVLLATLNDYSITNLATRDEDFLAASHIAVYAPTDL